METFLVELPCYFNFLGPLGPKPLFGSNYHLSTTPILR